MKLRSKTLVTLFATTIVLMVALVWFMRWSFERGALTYVHQQDQAQLGLLSAALADLYKQQGSFQQFQDDPASWWRWTRQFAHQSLEPAGDGGRPTPAFDDHGHRPSKPFLLLDAGRQLIVGKTASQARLVPILVDDQPVGFVGLPPPPKHMQAFLRGQLAARQTQNFIWVALLALVVSVLVAIPLSSRLIGRILALRNHVKELSAGHYQQRLSLGGRDELTELAEHLNGLAVSLQQAESQRRQTVADISHELRTPLASLQADIEALQDGVRPLSQESVARLHDQVLRLATLINDLYSLSLADVGALTYRKQPCDLRPLIDHLFNDYQVQFQQANLFLEVIHRSAGPLMVFADEGRLRQLFGNLLQNSLRYTDSSGWVAIETVVDHGAIQVTVKDSAPGVDPNLYARLTERLFRIDGSRNRSSGGAGLGLNLCQKIVEAHEGQLNFSESDMGGLAVVVRLPQLAG